VNGEPAVTRSVEKNEAKTKLTVNHVPTTLEPTAIPAYAYQKDGRWWHNAWMVPLLIAVAIFLAYSLPPYLSLQSSQARIPYLHKNIWWHYPSLVGHVFFGTIALATVVVQMWPWLRRQHPAIHRVVGRIYVFGGMLPTALLALVIVPFSAGPPGNAIAAFLWITTTLVGFRMGRLHRWADHRRWMTYSFAMALQPLWGRILLVWILPLFPNWNFNNPNEFNITLESATWIGWVINLILAQVWLEWTARRARRALAAQPQ
jgi:hypothetical protein